MNAFIRGTLKTLAITALLIAVAFCTGWAVDSVLGSANLKYLYAAAGAFGSVLLLRKSNPDNLRNDLQNIVTAILVAAVIGGIVGWLLPAQAAAITGWLGYGGSLWLLAAVGVGVFLVLLYVLGLIWHAITNR